MASRNLLQFSQRSGRSRKNRACKNKNRPCLLKFRNQIWRSGKDCELRGSRALSSECTIARRTTIKCFVLNFLSSPRNGICLTYLLYQLVAFPWGALRRVCDWTKRDVISRWVDVFWLTAGLTRVGFVRKLSVIGLLKRWMGVFLRAYYRRREEVGQLKNCAYYIIESELRAGDSLKFGTRGVWLWETNEDWLAIEYKCDGVWNGGDWKPNGDRRGHLVSWCAILARVLSLGRFLQ